MKHLCKNLAKGMFICSVFALQACSGNSYDIFWNGQWERTIKVPKGVQGRCVHEVLTLSDKSWHLRTIVYATYDCKKASLELAYEGTLNTVEIVKETNDRELFFQVDDIHLVEMANISLSSRDELSVEAVEKLSEKYVPASRRQFRQKVHFNVADTTMKSTIYLPTLELAIPEYPQKDRMLTYHKIEAP